ncbi:MAG: ureidoglycolate lyase [Gammaproteobacteria bacterium]
MTPLHIEPLTSEAFFEFGDVIEMDPRRSQPMNRGMAERFAELATVETYGEGARAAISLVHSKRYELPHNVDLLERHPLGSQAFIPLDQTPFIVVVATGSDDHPGELHAFSTNGRQGINYRAGTWHSPLLTPFDAMGFVCVDRTGAGQNCEEWEVPESRRFLIEM